MTNEKIKAVLKDGYLPTVWTLEAVRAQGNNPSIFFRSEADRDAFTSRCPKSLRVHASFCGGFDQAKYGLIPTNGKVPFACIITARVKTFRGSGENKLTGPVNETGDARREKFLNLIEENCEIVPTFES